MPISPFIEAILQGREPSVQDFMTPGINPGARDYRQDLTSLMMKQQPQKPQGAFGKVDQFLGTPGGGFLMNLLAQSGYSKMPHSPLGAIGKAALMSSQQQQAKSESELQKRLIESTIGLNAAKSVGELQGSASDPLTAVGKARADLLAGVITQDQYDKIVAAEVNKNARNIFTDTNTARGQYRTDVSGPRAALSGLAAAEGLLSVNNAIGDTAAFTSFIRSIDNSVVRPAEQEAYNRALGLRNTIEATVQQWAGKGPLPPQTKRALLDSIRKLRGIMEGIVDRTTAYYNKEAGKYGLDPESVTGLPVKFDQVDVPIPDAAADSAVSNQPDVAALEADIARLEAEIAAAEGR